VKGWAVVFTGPNYAAEVVLAALQSSGFRAELLTDTGHLWPGLNAEDTRVFVPEEQVEGARALIDGEFSAGQG